MCATPSQLWQTRTACNCPASGKRPARRNAKLDERISKFEQFLANVSSANLRDLEDAAERERNYTAELLRTLFDTQRPADEFTAPTPGVSYGNASEAELRADVANELRTDINRLKSLKDRIDLYSHETSESASRPTRTFVIALLALFAITSLLVWQLPRIHQYGLGAISYLVYVFSALVSAIVLFKFLDSTAEVTGQHLGLTIRFGGAAALFIVVLLVGLNYEQAVNAREDQTFAAKFYVTLRDGTKVPADGAVTLRLDAPTLLRINDGYATLPIDRRYLDQSVAFDLKLVGYANDQRVVKLTLSPITIFVHLAARITSPAQPTATNQATAGRTLLQEPQPPQIQPRVDNVTVEQNISRGQATQIYGDQNCPDCQTKYGIPFAVPGAIIGARLKTAPPAFVVACPDGGKCGNIASLFRGGDGSECTGKTTCFCWFLERNQNTPAVYTIAVDYQVNRRECVANCRTTSRDEAAESAAYNAAHVAWETMRTTH